MLKIEGCESQRVRCDPSPLARPSFDINRSYTKARSAEGEIKRDDKLRSVPKIIREKDAGSHKVTVLIMVVLNMTISQGTVVKSNNAQHRRRAKRAASEASCRKDGGECGGHRRRVGTSLDCVCVVCVRRTKGRW